MPDREKVIKGLQEAYELIMSRIPERYMGYAPYACLNAMQMLAEQEAVPVEWQGIPLCGACKAAFLNLRPQKYCHECGRKGKWDD